MRRVVFLAVAVALAACGPGRGAGPVPFGKPLVGAAGPLPVTFDKMAIDAARNGYCEEAIPLLTCFAYQGRGSEMARTTLGACLLEGAKTGDARWTEGLTWLRRAGDAGFAEAQRELIVRLSQSSAQSDLVEAQKWRLIYQRETLSPIPRAPLPSDALAQLEEKLTTETRLAAQASAQSWSYRFWDAPPGDPRADAAREQCPKMRGPRAGRERRFNPGEGGNRTPESSQ